MHARLNMYASPDTIKPLAALHTSVDKGGLEQSLIDLVRVRASQINGCAFCIYSHTAEAREHGEIEQRLYMLDSWQESPLYSDRERAALAWTEAVTLISQTHAPDEVFATVRAQFTDDEIVKLTMAIADINAWNRFGIAFRMVHPMPRDYVSAKSAPQSAALGAAAGGKQAADPGSH
jgi:AhpD family alkylhydroperoxidase